jgi:L-threonylcarbamoyladenylate synthase
MKEEIRKAVEVLRKGGLILYPTDTIWGIGCDATNKDAVAKIFALKKREESKAMIVLIDHPDNLSKYIKEIPEVANDLLEHADKPLTIIYPGAVNLASNLVAEDGSIAIRVVKDEFCEQMIRSFGKPVVSTSANISGEAVASGFSEINESIKNGVDHIVDHKRNVRTGTTPSSIIKLAVNGEFSIIR